MEPVPGALDAPGVPLVALVILDGWGCAPDGPGNAVALAQTPTFDAIVAASPHTTMAASGLDVGLPAGQIGNSEVGHLNLGAGRIVYQDLTRIDRAIEDGTFDDSQALQDAADAASAGRGVLHLVGLASFGGVHSSLNHLVSLAHLAARRGVREVLVHAITDGRDVAPDASFNDMEWLERRLKNIEARHDGCRARIASVVGRYWAMDRDGRWERTRRAWELLTEGTGRTAASARDAVRMSHEEGVTDEFVEPFVIASDGGGARIDPGDAVVFFNFRPDRMRQLVRSLSASHLDELDRGRAYRPVRRVACMTQYDPTFDLPVAFAPTPLTNSLPDVLAEHGMGQLHVAETEKYAHVTYFFNGGVEVEHVGELRALAQSPRDVATYDKRPEMAAAEVARLAAEGIANEDVRFAIVNFANPDMVGHTGVIDAAVRACEAADAGLSRILAAVAVRGGVAIVTADHGNAEQMLTAEGKPHTAHTTNVVPVVLVGDLPGAELRPGGRLADVAPTVLQLLGIEQPPEMDGRSLLA